MSEVEDVCAGAGLVLTGRRLPARESRLWVVGHALGLAVLRRLDPGLYPVDASWVGRDLEWLHEFLARLSTTAFPAPVPLPAFGDVAWTRTRAAWWDLVSYLPGEPIGWQAQPPLSEVGQLMAAFHQASMSARTAHQRPAAVPLDAIVAEGATHELGEWVDSLAADLGRIRHEEASRTVIHGDFTAHNVLATGDPPHATGVIDFALAHVEDPLADIGYCLWRSGRPQQDAVDMDLNRVSLLVRGYHLQRPLRPVAADAIAVYVRARGVQQAVEAFRRTGEQAPDLLARRVDWLTRHQSALRHCIRTAIVARS